MVAPLRDCERDLRELLPRGRDLRERDLPLRRDLLCDLRERDGRDRDLPRLERRRRDLLRDLLRDRLRDRERRRGFSSGASAASAAAAFAFALARAFGCMLCAAISNNFEVTNSMALAAQCPFAQAVNGA